MANSCNEPIKLNGSIPLIAQPVITFDSDLLTSVGAFWTPTSPVTPSSGGQQHRNNQQHHTHQRQHQILLAGTSEGELKRIALLDNPQLGGSMRNVRGHLLDSVQISDLAANEKPNPILADMILLPAEQDQLQSALVATPNKLVKLRVNGCRLQAEAASNSSAGIWHNCASCAALEDPLCGWCSSAGACMSRHACLQRVTPTHLHSWQPFDQIRCSDYEPVSPPAMPVQASTGSIVEVNVPLQQQQQQPSEPGVDLHQQLTWKLAQAQFQCHFDYLAHANKSQLVAILGSSANAGAHTKALQARFNLHTNTVTIGCPLPNQAHRPSLAHANIGLELSSRLSLRMEPNLMNLSAQDAQFLEEVLNLKTRSDSNGAHLERTLTFYDCNQLTAAGCATCASSSHNCVWCPLANKCTFNGSHPEFGCQAQQLSANQYKQVAVSKYQVSAASPIEKPHSCPATAVSNSQQNPMTTAATSSTADAQQQPSRLQQQHEILIAHQSRRAVVIPLKPNVLPQIVSAGQQIKRAGGTLKVECLFELDEDSRARVAAKLVQSAPPESPSSPAIICQEMTFAYGDELAIQRAQVQVIMNDNQIVETSEGL